MDSSLQLISVSVILITFLICLVGINSKGKTLSAISSNGPTILTSFGIFFTFLGIFLALQAFDVLDMDGSIPKLLGGLKLAFLSSVVGLGASLFFRMVCPSIRSNQSVDDASAEDLLLELREITKGTNQVREALVGEGDSSLSTQFSKLRNDFRDFAEKVSEDGSKALVEALEAVIRDFNEKISEQFGDNFKQLNDAVGAQLEWQQEHKEQVRALTEAFLSAQSGIDEVQKSVQLIEGSTQQIPEHMDKITAIFEATDQRMSQLYEGLSSLDEMKKNAENAVPSIKEQITNLTEGLKQSIQDELSVIDKQFGSMRDSQMETQQTIKDLTGGLNDLMASSFENSEKMYAEQQNKFQGVLDSLNIAADNVLESTKKVGTEVESIVKDFSESQKSTSNDIKSRIDQSLAENTELMNQSLQTLDKGMQEQLQRSLDKMGNNLVSITDRFVETYEQSASKIIDLTSKISRN
jgi:methyl-accepting chemotaxis protein